MSAWIDRLDAWGEESRGGCCDGYRKPCPYHDGMQVGLEMAWMDASVRPAEVIEHLGGRTLGTVNQEGFVLADANIVVALDPGSPVFVFPKGSDK